MRKGKFKGLIRQLNWKMVPQRDKSVYKELLLKVIKHRLINVLQKYTEYSSVIIHELDGTPFLTM